MSETKEKPVATNKKETGGLDASVPDLAFPNHKRTDKKKVLLNHRCDYLARVAVFYNPLHRGNEAGG